MKQLSEKQKKLYFILALALIYIIIALGNNHFRRMIIYRKNRKILEKQIADLQKKNDELKKRIDEFEKNPEKAYYRVARDEYGMIRKGELKYRFIDKKK